MKLMMMVYYWISTRGEKTRRERAEERGGRERKTDTAAQTEHRERQTAEL